MLRFLWMDEDWTKKVACFIPYPHFFNPVQGFILAGFLNRAACLKQSVHHVSTRHSSTFLVPSNNDAIAPIGYILIIYHHYVIKYADDTFCTLVSQFFNVFLEIKYKHCKNLQLCFLDNRVNWFTLKSTLCEGRPETVTLFPIPTPIFQPILDRFNIGMVRNTSFLHQATSSDVN